MERSLAYSNMAKDADAANSMDAQIMEMEKEFGVRDTKGNLVNLNDDPADAGKNIDKEIAEVEKYLKVKPEHQPDVPRGTGEAPESEESVFKRRKNNSLVQAVGGLAEAAQNTLNFGVEVADIITNKIGAEKLIDESSKFTFADENFPRSEQFGANAVRSTAQFLTLFIPGGQAAGVARMAGAARVTAAAATGFAADALAFKGNEGRLSDMLKDTPFGDLALPYLVTNKNDSELEGRLKNAIEGLGLGVLGDAAFAGLKHIKAMRSTRKALEGVKSVEASVPGSVLPGEKAASHTELRGEIPAQEAAPTQKLSEPETPEVNPLAKNNPEFFEKTEVTPEEVLAGKVSAEDMQRSGGYKLNLNKIDSDEQVLNAIKNVAEKDKDAITARTRGTVPNVELDALAKETGVSAESLMNKKVGEAFSAEELHVARQFHAAAADDLLKKAKIASASGDDSSLVEFYEAFSAFRNMNYVVTGAKAEAGRALQSLSMKISGSADPQILKDFLNLANVKDVKQMAFAISEMKPDQLGKVAQKTLHKRVVEATLEVYRNNLLSGPKTHIVNFVSNASTYAQSVMERGLAARTKATGSVINPTGLKEAMSQRSKLLQMDKSKMSYVQLGKWESELARLNKVMSSSVASSVEVGEGTQMMLGAFNGIMDGIRALKNSGKEGLQDLVSKSIPTAAEKFEVGSGGYNSALTAENLNVSADSFAGKSIDMIGNIQRIPGKGLAWADDFWKFVNYRSEVSAQAYRMSKKLGLSGDEAKTYMKEFMDNPPEYVSEVAQKNASINTFTNDPEGFAQSVENLVNTDVFGAPYLRFAIPFIRAPLNIAKFGVERTPIAPFLDSYKAALAKGGSEAQLAKAKVRLGSSIMAGFGIMSMQGMVTGGGPKDPKARQQLEMTGWKPYSLKIDSGDKVTFVPLNKLEPIGTLMGLASDMAEIVGEQTDESGVDIEQLIGMSVVTVANLFTPEMLVDSVGDVMNALNGDEFTIRKMLSNTTSKSIPLVGMANVARQVADPIGRQIDNRDIEGSLSTLQEIVSKAKNQIPGLSNTLPARKNIFGEDMPVVPGFGSILNPFASASQNKNDVVMQELIELGYSPTFIQEDNLPEGESHLKIDYPPRQIKMGNGIVNLTVEQHAKYVELSAGVGLKEDYKPYPGKTLKEAMAEVIKSNYAVLGSQITDQNRRTVLKSIITGYRNAARAQMLEEFPEMIERMDKSREGYIKSRTSDPDIKGVE